GWCVPNRRTASHRMIGASGPSITAKLAGLRQDRHRIAPVLASRAVRRPAYSILPAGDAAVGDAVVVEGRTSDGVATFMFLNGRLPRHIARLHVQGHDGGAKLREKQQPLIHRQTAIDPATTEAALQRETGPVLPEDVPILGIQREDILVDDTSLTTGDVSKEK